ncbi:3-oxoacyl-(acyl-carrier-protein) synthase III [Desulfocapsa sulfexigens DSM 10523]|uniref:Beta-ketoacyl-[acyl-carrier-protein] synthase III n=1 Tax=Desulfocapsa sulfexigens (strain DSM 10523 / SB164P1) TaxID=1167006 RepID=M1PRX0_DESSD|nr:beta-ketoacyl-ACP synthase III [Desulfocapsa sulfexigens]AGF79101.1 3-oxoacyl-(acyl-carrier-protein) synthase III [Desulfocapsa sulfexigens DSM 10523]
MGAVILGTGSCLPERVVSNHDLEQLVETSDEWIVSRTGISTRRISGKGENTFQLATSAAKKAMDMAKVTADDIDLIIVATMSSHMLMPSCACFVQKELGAQKAYAYDVNAACSGFLFALDNGDKHLRVERQQKILIIGTETLSSRTNWKDRNTCILFGDGAGAVVLEYQDENRGIVASSLFSDGTLWNLLYMHTAPSCNPEIEQADNPGAHILMEGREVFKYAVKAMQGAIENLLVREQIDLDAIDVMIPHQANIRILKKLVSRLGIKKEKVFINVQKYGNTSAASIPIALDEANREGRLKRGDLLLVCSFGGGFTWGASLIRW